MCTFLWISFIDGPLWAVIRRPPPPSCHKMSNYNGALPHLFTGRNGFSLPRASMPWAWSGGMVDSTGSGTFKVKLQIEDLEPAGVSRADTLNGIDSSQRFPKCTQCTSALTAGETLCFCCFE